MAVTEALELQDGLQSRLGRDLEALVVNALLPRRFSAEEMRKIAALEDVGDGHPAAGKHLREGAPASPAEDLRAVSASAVRAARAIHDRARFQHNQLARLRRRSFDVVGIPFVWGTQLDLADVDAIATRLARTV
jgi:hypothetical protein